MKIAKVPFMMDFGDTVVVERGNWLHADDKSVQVLISALKNWFPIMMNNPINTKYEVGISSSTGDMVSMWRDENNDIHIGCISESHEVFKKKFIQLVKHLNNK